MSSLVRSLTGLQSSTNTARAVHELSTGATLVVVPDAGNLYVYYSADRITWTLKATISSAISSWGKFSSAIGPDNSLHVVFIGTDNKLKYLKLANSGTTWTAGSTETVSNLTTQRMCDIDILDVGTAGVPLVVAQDTASPANVRLFVRRTSDNAWLNFRSIKISNGGYSSDAPQGVQIARGVGGVNTGTTTATFAITALVPDKTVFAGDIIVTGAVVNYSSGANSSNGVTVLWFTGSPKGDMRTYQLFSVGTNTWDWGVWYGGSYLDVRAGRLNLTGWLVQPKGLTFPAGTPMYRQPTFTDWCSIGHSGEALSVFFYGKRYGIPHSAHFHARITDLDVTWIAPNSDSINPKSGDTSGDYWDAAVNSGRDNDQDFIYMHSGNNRNFSSRRVGVLLTQQFSLTQTRYAYNSIQPTALVQSPANAGTVTTNTPTLTARITSPAIQQSRRKPVFQVAKDSGFSTALQTITSPDTSYAVCRGSGNSDFTYKIPDLNSLTQGLWYLRAATIDAFGVQSAWSATTTFTVSHPPSASIQSPNTNAKLDYGVTGDVSVNWDFSSTWPQSVQTAYEVVVETNSSTPTSVADTGKVTSANENGTVNIPAAYKSVPLRWKVRVWDEDDVVSNYSDFGTFEVVEKGTVAISTPTDGATINTPTPTLNWTFTPPASDTTITQNKYRITVYSGLTQKYTSNWLADGATAFQIPNGYLDNSSDYTITLDIQDSNGLQISRTITVHTSWTPPTAPAFTVDPTGFELLGYVSIAWTNALKDDNWVSWRVYRQDISIGALELAYETLVDQANYIFYDYLVGSGKVYKYIVIQTANRFGSLVESNYAGTSANITPVSSHYWLIDTTLDNSTNNAIKIPNVTSDSYTDEQEKQVLQLIDRGRKVDFGTRWGYTGSLQAKLYDDAFTGVTARQKRQSIEALKNANHQVYLRNPFGDVLPIAVDDLQVGRISGVGLREFCDITIPYLEVAT